MRVAQEHVRHPGEAFRFLRIEVDAFRGARHRHPELELTWIQQGFGMRFVGDDAAPFEAGDLVLLGADVPHAWASAGRSRATPSIATVIQFPPSLLEQPALPELRLARPLAERARFGLAIGGDCRLAVIAVLRALESGDRFARLAGLVQILGLLLQHTRDLRPIAASPMRPPSRPQGSRRIDRVTDWVYANMARELRAAEAARLARVSTPAFSRFFRREVGKPFSTYVNEVRCGEACLKLRQSARPIALIAEDCGFRSLSHFNRQFRRRTGVTPRQYRRGA